MQSGERKTDIRATRLQWVYFVVETLTHVLADQRSQNGADVLTGIHPFLAEMIGMMVKLESDLDTALRENKRESCFVVHNVLRQI